MRKRKNLVCGRKKPELQGGHYSALTPALDPHLQKMTELADRVVLHLQRAGSVQRQKAEAKMPGAQRTLEAYS
jgi:hypothetical protein